MAKLKQQHRTGGLKLLTDIGLELQTTFAQDNTFDDSLMEMIDSQDSSKSIG